MCSFFKKGATKLKVSRKETYGSLDLGIIAPNSFILSFMLNLLRLSTTQGNTQICAESCNVTVNKQYTTGALNFFWTHWDCDYLSSASPLWKLWHLCLTINSYYDYYTILKIHNTTNSWNQWNTEGCWVKHYQKIPFWCWADPPDRNCWRWCWGLPCQDCCRHPEG